MPPTSRAATTRHPARYWRHGTQACPIAEDQRILRDRECAGLLLRSQNHHGTAPAPRAVRAHGTPVHRLRSHAVPLGSAGSSLMPSTGNRTARPPVLPAHATDVIAPG